MQVFHPFLQLWQEQRCLLVPLSGGTCHEWLPHAVCRRSSHLLQALQKQSNFHLGTPFQGQLEWLAAEAIALVVEGERLGLSAKSRISRGEDLNHSLWMVDQQGLICLDKIDMLIPTSFPALFWLVFPPRVCIDLTLFEAFEGSGESLRSRQSVWKGCHKHLPHSDQHSLPWPWPPAQLWQLWEHLPLQLLAEDF